MADRLVIIPRASIIALRCCGCCYTLYDVLLKRSDYLNTVDHARGIGCLSQNWMIFFYVSSANIMNVCILLNPLAVNF